MYLLNKVVSEFINIIDFEGDYRCEEKDKTQI